MNMAECITSWAIKVTMVPLTEYNMQMTSLVSKLHVSHT